MTSARMPTYEFGEPIPCPTCGETVEGWEVDACLIYEVNGGQYPGGGHVLVGGWSEDSVPPGGWITGTEHLPAEDRWTLRPCGHDFHGFPWPDGLTLNPPAAPVQSSNTNP